MTDSDSQSDPTGPVDVHPMAECPNCGGPNGVCAPMSANGTGTPIYVLWCPDCWRNGLCTTGDPANGCDADATSLLKPGAEGEEATQQIAAYRQSGSILETLQRIAPMTMREPKQPPSFCRNCGAPYHVQRFSDPAGQGFVAVCPSCGEVETYGQEPFVSVLLQRTVAELKPSYQGRTLWDRFKRWVKGRNQ